MGMKRANIESTQKPQRTAQRGPQGGDFMSDFIFKVFSGRALCGKHIDALSDDIFTALCTAPRGLEARVGWFVTTFHQVVFGFPIIHICNMVIVYKEAIRMSWFYKILLMGVANMPFQHDHTSRGLLSR